jgi:hypothetical protein
MDMGIVVLFIVLVLSGVIIWRVSEIPAPARYSHYNSLRCFCSA